MQYMLLIYIDPEQEARLTPEEGEALLDRYRRVKGEIEAEGKLVAALKLPRRSPKSLRLEGDGLRATDGPFVETKELLGGFFIVDCESIDDAVEIAALIPAAETGCVEVRGVMDLDAMFAAR